MAKTAFQVASAQLLVPSGCPHWSIVDFIRGELAHSGIIRGRNMQCESCRKEEQCVKRIEDHIDIRIS